VAIDDENGALGHAGVALDVIAPDAVGGNELPLEVADQLKRKAAQLGGERLVREDGVDADSVDADTGSDRVVVP
jgi:hypothetical protein